MSSRKFLTGAAKVSLSRQKLSISPTAIVPLFTSTNTISTMTIAIAVTTTISAGLWLRVCQIHRPTRLRNE